MSEIGLLEKLVSINSVFPNERELGEFLEGELKERGFAVRRVEAEGRFCLVGERGTEGEPVMLYGHMDTVPKYGEWSSDPFALREEEDKLYGLGAYDMKAGIAAILKACEEHSERRVRVAFGVDEENNSAGSWALVNEGAFEGVQCVIVPEINDSPDTPGRADAIVLGRRGRAVYEINVPGESMHGAQSTKGTSAISEAARLVAELENAEMPSHEKLPDGSQFIRKIHAETSSLSLPENAAIELDRHLVTPETTESVLAQLRELIERLYSEGKFNPINGRKISVGIKERHTPYLPPYTTPENDPNVARLAEIVRKEVGEPQFTYGYTVCDENAIATTGVPVIDYGPVGANYHSADEWVSKQSYLDLIKVLRRFIQ
ncbi:M20/M25/M40 family metallo-hydrolase [Candidatus Micrarchaeota archaeon]|nr:M20/M25/M40 family metallo-hydrolase [Candidatus Micrarchaeota archaeon]MBD3418107.1 M20/M25/M40 family metallo-hydrolase [Candidatus Micrarchaeota archaeon]